METTFPMLHQLSRDASKEEISCQKASAMFSVKPGVKRKSCDEHRHFPDKWEIPYFFAKHRNTPMCLIWMAKVAAHKEYNIKRHYSTKHVKEYEKY